MSGRVSSTSVPPVLERVDQDGSSGPIRVGFALLSKSGDPAPSTRVAALQVLPLLEGRGFRASVVFEPDVATETPNLDEAADAILQSGCEAVVFQKIRGPSVLALVRRLSQSGVASVYMVCDLVDPEMARATDATVTVTEYLRGLYPPELQPRISVVHDGIERPEIERDGSSLVAVRRAHRLHAVIVTSQAQHHLPVLGVAPRGYDIEIVGRFPPADDGLGRTKEVYRALVTAPSWDRRIRVLATSLDPRVRKIAWHPEDVYERLRCADVGLLPIETSDGHANETPPAWKVKSENRLTLMMSIGLPVVATPIPSYESIVEHGVNGFFARSRADWLRCLRELRDPALRADIGRRARASVHERFSKSRQADLLAHVLERVVSSRAGHAADPPVAVIPGAPT